MRFEKPAGPNAIDQLKVVGQPLDRLDGPRKTTGTATYAYEHHDAGGELAYGEMVPARIAFGHVVAIDTSAAMASPGVINVITARQAGPLATGDFYTARVLVDMQVQHYHQAIAVVVAQTYEQARAAAALVRVDYVREAGRFNLDAARTEAKVPKTSPDVIVGDFDAAFSAAPIQVDQVYRTPDQSHAMMEPHATLARWQNGKLTLWTSVQIVQWILRDLSKILGVAREDIRVISPYIGGGFGGKATALADAVLAATAARVTGRAVKVMLPRPAMFNNTTHRPATIQRVRLGAQRDGTLLAIGHDSWSGNLEGAPEERCTLPTKSLYAGANRLLRTRLARLDLPEGNAMRAPGEAPGLAAFEIAMDELAEQLGMDPVELRIRNDTQDDPAHPGRTFSTRRFADCLRLGAERFGWRDRSPAPASRRKGNSLIGMGVAGAIRGNNVSTSGARVRLDRNGIVTVETDMTDIGTGSYTIIGQTAAEVMGLALEQVVVKLGDSSFPAASGSLGQRGANSSTSGVYAACMKLRKAVARAIDRDVGGLRFEGGKIVGDGLAIPLAKAADAGDIVAEDAIEFGAGRDALAHQTFGAHFCEVAVDAFTGEARVRRMLAVCDAGRILNPQLARSQVIGAMTMGLGSALMESLEVDCRLGYFVNHDLAGYEVPVHADVPHLDVVFIDEADPNSSPMKAKGVSELGISGVAAAVANAVYNATGARVRDYPVTLDKLLHLLPQAY